MRDKSIQHVYLVKILRKKKGITLKELSDAIGVPYTTVVGWERGIWLPSDENLTKIAKYFKLPRSKIVKVKD